jgi:hypothetical protein
MMAEAASAATETMSAEAPPSGGHRLQSSGSHAQLLHARKFSRTITQRKSVRFAARTVPLVRHAQLVELSL